MCRYDQAALDEVNPKKKITDRLFPDMKTDSSESWHGRPKPHTLVPYPT